MYYYMPDTSKQPDKDSATTSACAGTAFPAQARNVLGQFVLSSGRSGTFHIQAKTILLLSLFPHDHVSRENSQPPHQEHRQPANKTKPVPDDGEQQSSCLRVLPTIVSVAKPVVQTPA
jgi:hypothetical protein